MLVGNRIIATSTSASKRNLKISVISSIHSRYRYEISLCSVTRIFINLTFEHITDYQSEHSQQNCSTVHTADYQLQLPAHDWLIQRAESAALWYPHMQMARSYPGFCYSFRYHPSHPASLQSLIFKSFTLYHTYRCNEKCNVNAQI